MSTALRLLGAAAVFAGLCLGSACRKESVEIIRIKPTSFTAEDEAAIGRRLASESWRNENVAVIEPDRGEFTDGVYHFLRPLVRGLVAQPAVTRRDSFEWEVHVVLDREPHAYTLPGGQIVLHTGLLNGITSEAECVGILAREIALAESGAAMAALDRQVDDNVTLGDMILGNLVPLDHIIEALPQLAYTAEEMRVADSLAAELVCPSDYEERGLPMAVGKFEGEVMYNIARPAEPAWTSRFEARVAECPGADSLYARRYRRMLSAHVPR